MGRLTQSEAKGVCADSDVGESIAFALSQNTGDLVGLLAGEVDVFARGSGDKLLEEREDVKRPDMIESGRYTSIDRGDVSFR